MRFPLLFWAIIVVTILVIAAVILFARRRPARERVYVANAATIEYLPAFRTKRKLTRIAAGIVALGLVGAQLAAAFLAGAPVDRHVTNPLLARRDMVLCLDASGSMLPYDGAILDAVSELVEHFSGERMALEMWSAQSIVKFPLTDDYALMQDVLEEGAAIIKRGYLGPEGDYVLVTVELSDYLEGIDLPGVEISSLVGDGLASCVLSFDHRDQDRSRTILLATDNEVQGEQIYTLTQAIKFASDQGIQVIALYPADRGVLTSEGEELKRLVENAGGSFYEASDPSSVDAIIDDVQSQQLEDTSGGSRLVETDRPESALSWLVLLGLVTMATLAWLKL